MKKLIATILLSLMALPAIAIPSAVRDDKGNVYVWGDGVTANIKYLVNVGGAIVTKRLIANECGILKIPDRPALRTAVSFKMDGVDLPDFWNDSPVVAVPSCRQGNLTFAAPGSIYYTEYPRAKNGNTYTFNDVYVSGLEPFSGHDIEMNDPTIVFTVSANACGIVAIRSTSTRQIPFTSGNGVWLNTKEGGYQVKAMYPASNIPVGQGPICKNGNLYVAN